MNLKNFVVKILDNDKKTVLGSGFFISPKGYLITCEHVINEGEYNNKEKNNIYYKFASDITNENKKGIFLAELTKKDENSELVLLKSLGKLDKFNDLEKVDNNIEDIDYVPIYNQNNEEEAKQKIKKDCETLGFRKGSPKGNIGHATFYGFRNNGREIELGKAKDITSGFSGAPIIYENVAIGMVTDISKEDEFGRAGESAFGISAKKIIEAFSDYIHTEKIFERCNINELKEELNEIYLKNFQENKQILDKLKEKCLELKKFDLKDEDIEQINDIIYHLSDIYEKNRYFETSLELMRKNFESYEIKNSLKDNIDAEKLRKYIGCIYSFAISNPDNNEECKRRLDIAEKHLKKANEYKNFLFNKENIRLDIKDKYFIEGLYNSDYGAFLISRGKYKNRIGEKEKAIEDFKLALQIHNKALEERTKLMKEWKSIKINHTLSDSKIIDKNLNESIVSMGISNRNIATAYFWLNDYKNNLENLHKAIKLIDESIDPIEYYNTIDRITGTYLNIFEKKEYTENIYIDFLDGFKECCGYLLKTKNYFGEKNNSFVNEDDRHSRLINAEERIEETIKIVKGEKGFFNNNEKEETKVIFNTIFFNYGRKI